MRIEAERLTPLPRSFYERGAVRTARALLGMLVCRRTAEGLAVGRIVETEAYLPRDDPASHAYRGPGRRNASMFGPPGRAYVFPIHARVCFNVVTDPPGVGSAVLIRALEPLEGIELMRRRRGTARLRELARGPARLCEALAITRALDGWDLTRGQALWLAAGQPPAAGEVRRTPRIGVTSAHDLPLRFIVAGSPYVSGPRRIAAQPG